MGINAWTKLVKNRIPVAIGTFEIILNHAITEGNPGGYERTVGIYGCQVWVIPWLLTIKRAIVPKSIGSNPGGASMFSTG